MGNRRKTRRGSSSRLYYCVSFVIRLYLLRLLFTDQGLIAGSGKEEVWAIFRLICISLYAGRLVKLTTRRRSRGR